MTPFRGDPLQFNPVTDKAYMDVYNRPLEDCGKIPGDHVATSAILDRFPEGDHIIKITGRSYRFKSQREKPEKNIDK